MTQKIRGGNRRVGTPSPNRKRPEKRGGREKGSLKNVVLPLIFVVLGAFGVWQCMDDEAESPLAPLKPAAAPKRVDVGEGKKPDPTLVNESALLEKDQLGKPSAADLAEAASGEPTEDRTIEAAGEQIEVDSDAELEAKYPLHGVAYHFHTQIFEKPDKSSRVVSYARRGATFRASQRVSKKDCPKGWHEIRDGGYICDGDGVNIAKEPITFEPSPVAPKLNEALPYEYKYVRRDGAAEYWKIPSPEEIETAQKVFAALDKKAAAVASNVTPPVVAENVVAAGDDAAHDEAALVKVLEKAASLSGDTEGGKADVPAVAAAGAGVVDSAAVSEDVAADVEMPPYVHLKMAKGYFVSVNQSVSSEGKSWAQTVRGRYINAADLYPASPSSFEGVLLGGRVSLPIAFVVNGGVKMLTRQGADGPLKNGATVERYSHFPVLGTITRGNREYVEIARDRFLFKRTIAVASLTAPPAGVGETERWVDVNLTEQTLVAYEGATPVFATLISSGREGFDTPVGEFRIYNKHVTITMDDPDAGAEAYSIEDVPWTQYFEEGYALHAAFWHDRFGKVRSHGCVNLSPADARRLFFWTGPHISEGVHGVIATRENPGTRVVIHL